MPKILVDPLPTQTLGISHSIKFNFIQRIQQSIINHTRLSQRTIFVVLQIPLPSQTIQYDVTRCDIKSDAFPIVRCRNVAKAAQIQTKIVLAK